MKNTEGLKTTNKTCFILNNVTSVIMLSHYQSPVNFRIGFSVVPKRYTNKTEWHWQQLTGFNCRN